MYVLFAVDFFKLNYNYDKLKFLVMITYLLDNSNLK